MIINVHAGHNPAGKVACGAVGIINESTEARRVKDEVIRQLRALGHTVYDCTVDDGTSRADVLTKIVNKCNAHDVDLDVSIHFNAGANDTNGNDRTTGTECYVYSASSKALDIAQKVVNAISNLGYKNRGVKYTTALYVLRKTTAPAMLIECCFVDDRDDVQLYDYQRIADAIVYGITGQRCTDVPQQTPMEDKVDAGAVGAETPTGDKNAIYRVQVGAYSVKGNAAKMQARLTAAGFDAVLVRA